MIQESPFRVLATRRTLAKQQTRQRLIDAARRLVVEGGYEAATVRKVAAAAGMSTGAVFANFADKAELLTEVILGEQRILLDRMRKAPAPDGSWRSILLSMLSAGYDLHFEQLLLAQAQLGGEGDVEARRRGADTILACIADVLKRGVTTGQLSPSINADLVAEMIWESYLANLRQVISGNWTAEAVRQRMVEQVDMLLTSFATGAPAAASDDELFGEPARAGARRH